MQKPTQSSKLKHREIDSFAQIEVFHRICWVESCCPLTLGAWKLAGAGGKQQLFPSAFTCGPMVSSLSTLPGRWRCVELVPLHYFLLFSLLMSNADSLFPQPLPVRSPLQLCASSLPNDLNFVPVGFLSSFVLPTLWPWCKKSGSVKVLPSNHMSFFSAETDGFTPVY